MSDIFDELNKIFKKDLVNVLVKYLKDQKYKVSDEKYSLFNDTQTLLNDIFEKFSKNKNLDNHQANYTNTEETNQTDKNLDNEYDDLYQCLQLIEENMIQIQKILKEKN